MAKIEILLPAMGEGITEASITKWMVKEGDFVEEDDSLVEIATDKVDSEIPSPASGKIKEILVKEGETPEVGITLAILETEAEVINTDEEISVPPIEENFKKHETEKKSSNDTIIKHNTELVKESISHSIQKNGNSKEKFLSPLVRSIAGKESISYQEIEQINGTGLNGRITKNDLLDYLKNKPLIKEQEKTTTISEIKPSLNTGDEIIEMDRVRKLIADHMINSKQTSPHVTSFIEVDVTNMVEWRNKIKDDFLTREKEKITFTPIIIEATAKAIKDFPMINVSVDGRNIIVKKNVNIGMATALPNGNLIVPVIKNTDEKNLLGITKSVNDLANRARNNKLKPDEIQGGTFSVTNFGTFQSVTGTPIINQPEVAILGIGTIKKKPAVIETPQGDAAIAIRQLMVLSLSYDHRVIDGALAGMFLQRIMQYLENFDKNRTV